MPEIGDEPPTNQESRRVEVRSLDGEAEGWHGLRLAAIAVVLVSAMAQAPKGGARKQHPTRDPNRGTVYNCAVSSVD